MIKTYSKDGNERVSKNFKVNEFSCHGKGCCSQTLIDTELVEILQKIRDYFGKPVKITSGYRCEKHNKAVGGASGSRHRYGMAADIKIDGVQPKDIAKYTESIGVKGIGLYETDKDGYFVHIDTRDKKAFWYGQGQAYRSTFRDNALVKEWQEAAKADGFNIKVDGIWGLQCEEVAEKAICKRCFWPWKYKNLTKFIQHRIGFAGTDVDGKFGSGTKEAVKGWQRASGFVDEDIDGVVGIKSWKKMLNI